MNFGAKYVLHSGIPVPQSVSTYFSVTRTPKVEERKYQVHWDAFHCILQKFNSRLTK